MPTLPREADLLIAAIEAGQGAVLAHCPEPESARKHFAGEMRMLRAARLIVFAGMCRQMAPAPTP